MPRDLFGNVTRPSISIGNRKWYTLPVSLLSHSAIVIAVVVVPLLATDVLPKPWLKMETPVIHLVPPSPPRPPKLRPVDPKVMVNRNAAPIAAPEGVTPEQPRVETGWEDAQPGPEVIDGLFDPAVIVAPPPPPPVPQQPVRVGMGVRSPQKVRDVQPVYPNLALISRTEGVVIIEATIGADGRVMNARVLRSSPLLDGAALEAVRQWEFTPTLLNGVPVPVIMTVTVNFSLKK